MPKRTSQKLDFTFVVKLNAEDRQHLNELQEFGINASAKVRMFLRSLYEENKSKLNANK